MKNYTRLGLMTAAAAVLFVGATVRAGEITSACCYSDGNCSNETLDSCNALGGIAHASLGCDDFFCPGEEGACCSSDGNCSPQTVGSCCELDGIYMGDGTTCEPNTCPGVEGACCFTDGNCAPLTFGSCCENGGIYRGDGTTCEPNTCPGVEGRCCTIFDGSCSLQAVGSCAEVGGVYLGDGGDPIEGCGVNTCPGWDGACCFPPGDPNGECSPLNIDTCRQLGGTYHGFGTTCSAATCATATNGACCFGDGSCTLSSLSDCNTDGGVYHGDGATCTPNTCPGSGGACCFSDGHCEVLTFGACDTGNGTYRGNGTTCQTGTCIGESGACCNPSGGCTVTSISECCADFASGGELLGTYRGDGTDCDPNTCAGVEGACCFSDGSCELASIGECCELDGVYRGDDTACSPTTCFGSTGACCDANGSCTDGSTGDCSADGGVFQGDGTTCAQTVCPQPPVVGACCSLSGCVDDVEAEDCDEDGGTFAGEGVACDSPENTACPIGACCVSSNFVAGADAANCIDITQVAGGRMTQAVCDNIGGTFLVGEACDETTCEVAGACCTPDCGCVRVSAAECETLGGVYGGDFTTCDAPYAGAVPQLTCPDPITLTRGDITECGSPLEIRDFLAGATLTGSTCDPEITHDAGECGFPPGTTTVTFTAIDCGQTFTCETTVTVDPLHRIESTQKGSLLVFSKVEIKWDAAGNLTQDTFLDFSNDSDTGAVDVQAFLINGDRTLEEITTDDGTVIQDAEPGWNRIDCRFELTKNQPHYWSAANGSSMCGAFTSLDGDGPGRPDPEVAGGRVLRGYVVMWAVKFNGEYYDEIRWNHLKGDALIINYAEGSAWEYNAWAAQARCGAHGDPVLDCLITDANGTCCLAEPIPGNIGLDGFAYDVTYDRLLLDFYATGTTALSATRADGSMGVGISLDTDLTLHSMDIDLRQDGDGPPLSKAEFEVFNQNEVKLSGLRRCICCWDQTMFSDYVQRAGIPNYFLLGRLGTDKGQARIDAVRSVVEECNYCDTCGVEPRIRRLGPTTAGIGEIIDVCQLNFSQDTALLGLSTKFVSFENGSVKIDRAGMNLVGTGEQTRVFQLEQFPDFAGTAAPPPIMVLQYGSRIQYDVPRGTDEARQPISISAPTRETRSGKEANPAATLRGDRTGE